MINEIYSSYHYSILKEDDKVVKLPKTEMGAFRLEQVKNRIKNFYHSNIDVPLIENGEAISLYYEKSLEDNIFDDLQLLNIFIQLAYAIEHLHKYHIFGIDLKPEHVRFLNEEVKLIDCFEPSTICPKWNAPESVLNRSVNESSDIYCVGNLIYYSVHKKLPFDDCNPLAYLSSLINKKPIIDETIFKNIISKCLEKQPEDRYKSIKDLRDDLIKLKNGIKDDKLTETKIEKK
jgi:serine/threonine protein kinase